MAKKFISQGFCTTEVLRFAGVARSTWYHSQRESQRAAEDDGGNRGRPVPGYTRNPDGTIVMDTSILKALREYREDLNFSNAGGYHKLKHYLRRDYGYYVNHKKLYRLCKEEGLLLPHRKKKLKKDRRVSSNRVITGPNQFWEFDHKIWLHPW